MRGGAGEEEEREESGVRQEQQHVPSPHHTAPLQHGGKTPPLSAAQSQASLSPSDHTVSDPDLVGGASSSISLASSSSMSSRPSSSSSGLVSPSDMHPVTDITHAVEEEEDGDKLPPLQHLQDTSTVYDYSTSELADYPGGPATTAGHSSLLNGSTGTLSSLANGKDYLLRSENGTGSDVEEEYFEEYHLPNTHENAFVRHCSFRRKVELTPINAPDAEKIEGLVRTGELERHGSVRRKIVANVSATDEEGTALYKLDEDRADDKNNGGGPKSINVQEFSEDFRAIRKMMDDECDYVDLQEKVVTDDEKIKLGNTLLNLNNGDGSGDTPKLLMRGKNAYTSTPNNVYASTADYASINLSASLHDHSRRGESSVDELESLSIEQSTLTKVRECMDFTKLKDIYSLTGKLQDMLTGVEVEEVLNNSHRYTDYIDTGVLEALFNSVSEQMSLTGQPMSISFNKPNEIIVVKEKEQLTEEQVELQNTIKQKLLMEELAMDSLPYIDPQLEASPVFAQAGDLDSGFDNPVVVMRKKKKASQDESDGESSRYSTIERRKSVKVSGGQNQIEVEGVFIESDFKNSNMKTIAAPKIDLLNSCSQDDLEGSDFDSRSNNELEGFHASDDSLGRQADGAGRLHLRVDYAYPDDQTSQMTIPSIRITRTESSKDDLESTRNECRSEENIDNSSVNNLYMEEPYTPCSEATSVDYNDPDHFGTCRPCVDRSSSVESRGNSSDAAAADFERECLAACEGPCVLPAPPQQFLADMAPSEEDERHWRSVVIGGVWRRIDMKVIAPYVKCITPGGQHAGHAVVCVSACQLPERTRTDYHYVMDNLFLYLLSRLEQLVSDDYILVYLSGGRNVANTGPSFHWLKAAYQMIDRKLRKNLQALLVVHPTLWVRTVVALTRPFISSKFYRKLTFVYSLTELAQLIPLDQLTVPDSVKEADFELMIREKKRNVPKRPKPAAMR